MNNMFDVRARAGTTDSIGSIIDVSRSLSDDIFDTVVAQIADDGGFNYDEFSQGKTCGEDEYKQRDLVAGRR